MNDADLRLTMQPNTVIIQDKRLPVTLEVLEQRLSVQAC